MNSATPDTVVQIIDTTIQKHNAHTQHTLYQELVWIEIFIGVFGTHPIDNNDPRWDKLFDERDGYGALRIAAECRIHALNST
jgi:hypothetical protein